MAEALAALARGEAVQPLRSVVRPAGGAGLLGIMPGHLGAPPPGALGLKVVTVFPGNRGARQGLPPRASCCSSTPSTARRSALLDAASITAIRTAAVSAVATRLLAREDAGDLALLGSGVQACTHLEALRLVRPLRRVRVWSRSPESARAFADRESERWGLLVEAAATPREAVDGADLICTVTAARRAGAGRGVDRAGCPRQRGRRLHAGLPRARRRGGRRARACSSTAGSRRSPRPGTSCWRGRRARSRTSTSRASWATSSSGARRRAPHRRGGHTVQVAGDRGRGPRRGPARSCEGARGGHRHPDRDLEASMRALAAPTLDEIRAARERIAGIALRTPLVRLNVDDAPAEIWLKLENLQPIGSFKLRGAGNAMRAGRPGRARRRRLHGERRQHGAGRGLVRPAARRAGTVVVPDHAPATKLAAIERLGGRVVKMPVREWWQVLCASGEARARRPLHPSGERPGGDRRQRHDRPRDPGGPAGRGHHPRALRRRRALAAASPRRIRALRPRREGLRLRGGDRRAARRLARRRRAADGRRTSRASSTASAARACSPRCGRSPRRCSPVAGGAALEEVAAAVRLLAERHRVIAEGAGAASVAAALAGAGPGGKVVCVVSGGNIDAGKLTAILDGRLP